MRKIKILFVTIIICFFVLSLGGCATNNDDISDDINDNINDSNKINDGVSYDDNDEIKDNSNNNDYANKWIDYVMSANISSIKLKYCIYDESMENEPEQDVIDISKDDLNRIFIEMKKGTISKSYYGGYGGPCTSSINIEYATDDINTELKLVYFKLLDFNSTRDNKVLSYLESSSYLVKKYKDDIDLDNEPWTFEYTYNEDIINTIYNEYKK